ncbi:glycosyltransferase [Alphaproteobacteria bacterium]|nr:glycosyltransferase [Alphaproteobacteria bacterium]
MKKIKLMQIVPNLNSGGVEQGTIDLANYLAEQKNNNIIISNGGALLSFLNKQYVSHYLNPVHSKNFLNMPFVAKKINKIIKENETNILHVRSRAPAWLLPFISKKNLITVSTFHNIYGHKNFLKKFYNKGMAKTDRIVAISKYVAEEIESLYNIDPKKITIINRGIDTDFFASGIEDHKNFLNFLKKYNIVNDKKIILYPGRLTQWKGQIEFLNIIEKLKDHPYFFYFVGDEKNTSYTKKLIQLIERKKLSENCKILGHLNKEDLKMMYQCSDLIVSFPLKPEGFGRIVSEALSMKKIIIAHNIGGANNQLEKLDSIYKIDSKEEELLERIILILNSSQEKFDKLKQIGREHVINNFSKKQMLNKYVDLYEEILN